MSGTRGSGIHCRTNLRKSGSKNALPTTPAKLFSESLRWLVVDPACPITPRYGHTAVPYNGSIYVFGGDGKDSRRICDLQKYNTESFSWTRPECQGCVPDSRSGHSCVVWRDSMVIFGGRDGRNHFGDIYMYNFVDETWSKLETRGALVKRRYRHSACIFGNCMFVFGGEQGGEQGVCFNDFYELNLETNEWREVHATGTVPEPRSGHTAVVHDGSMYIFGGKNKSPQYFRSIYRFRFDTRTWSQVTADGIAPPRTYNHSAFIYRNNLYVFGGYGIEGVESGPGIGHRHCELYEYSFDQNRWALVQTTGKRPSARLGHTITVINKTLFLFGGWDRNGYRADLHSIEFDDLMLDMKNLMFNKLGADVSFRCDDQTIYAHLPVIAARCPEIARKLGLGPASILCASPSTVSINPITAAHDAAMQYMHGTASSVPQRPERTRSSSPPPVSPTLSPSNSAVFNLPTREDEPPFPQAVSRHSRDQIYRSGSPAPRTTMGSPTTSPISRRPREVSEIALPSHYDSFLGGGNLRNNSSSSSCTSLSTFYLAPPPSSTTTNASSATTTAAAAASAAAIADSGRDKKDGSPSLSPSASTAPPTSTSMAALALSSIKPASACPSPTPATAAAHATPAFPTPTAAGGPFMYNTPSGSSGGGSHLAPQSNSLPSLARLQDAAQPSPRDNSAHAAAAAATSTSTTSLRITPPPEPSFTVVRRSSKSRRLVVEVRNIRTAVFKLLLEFIYTGTMAFDPTHTVDLWLTAEKLDLPRCVSLCAYQIHRSINTDNVLSILTASHNACLWDLKFFCFQFVRSNYDEVVMSPKIKDVHHELLIEISRIPTKSFETRVRPQRSSVFNEKRWTPEPSTLKEDLDRLVGNRDFSDVVFIVEGAEVPAHLCMLLLRPSAFSRMFQSGMRETSTRKAEISDVSIDTFKSLLHFIYTSNVPLRSVKDSVQLLELADRFMVTALLEQCAEHMLHNVDVRNALKILQVAHKCNVETVKVVCLRTISANFGKIAGQKALRKLPQELLVEIIQCHHCAADMTRSQ